MTTQARFEVGVNYQGGGGDSVGNFQKYADAKAKARDLVRSNSMGIMGSEVISAYVYDRMAHVGAVEMTIWRWDGESFTTISTYRNEGVIRQAASTVGGAS